MAAKGTLAVRIIGDARDFEKKLASIDGALSKFASGAVSAGASLAGLAVKAGAAGVAVAAAFGVKAIQTAAEFEKRVSAISAVSGLTGEALEKVRDKALQLGEDTAFSASEAALAMEELVKAGLNAEQVLGGAADATVALAAAGEVELAEAATIAANAMNQFSLSAKDMPRIADLIAGAANASAIDVSEFGLSLQQAGAVANLVGLSFDDLSVAIAAMGNAGIRGSDAGTSLKTFLARLVPQTEQATKAFRELGLITEEGANRFFDAQGEIRGLAEVADILSDALAGMTDEQKQATLHVLFGSDAIRAAAVVANEGADGIKRLAGEMDKISATSVAATRMDNFSGAIERLKGSLETLMIRAAGPLLPVLESLANGLDASLPSITAWFERVGEKFSNLLGVSEESMGGVEKALHGFDVKMADVLGEGGSARQVLSGFDVYVAQKVGTTGQSMDSLGETLRRVRAAWDVIWAEDIKPWFDETFIPWLTDEAAPAVGRAAWVIGVELAKGIVRGFVEWVKNNPNVLLPPVAHLLKSVGGDGGVGFEEHIQNVAGVVASNDGGAATSTGLGGPTGDLRFRAHGGPTIGRFPHVVGELGPEIFVPSGPGQIVPNHRMTGGFNIGTIVVRGTGEDDGRTVARELRRLAYLHGVA